MIHIENAIEEIKKNQANAYQAWKTADDLFDDPNHDEEFEDTIQRKYDEGFADALLSVLNLFEDIDLQKISANLHRSGAQDALIWLEEVYGEGLQDTGAWEAYMDEDN